MSPNTDSDSSSRSFQNKLINIHLSQTEHNLTLFPLIQRCYILYFQSKFLKISDRGVCFRCHKPSVGLQEAAVGMSSQNSSGMKLTYNFFTKSHNPKS